MYKIRVEYHKELKPELKYWAIIEVVETDRDFDRTSKVLPDIKNDFNINTEIYKNRINTPHYMNFQKLEDFVKNDCWEKVKMEITRIRKEDHDKSVLPETTVLEF